MQEVEKNQTRRGVKLRLHFVVFALPPVYLYTFSSLHEAVIIHRYFGSFRIYLNFYDMRHKWDNKITKTNQFATCLRCNLVKESIYPYGIVYFVDSSNDFLTKAPPCKNLNSETEK